MAEPVPGTALTWDQAVQAPATVAPFQGRTIGAEYDRRTRVNLLMTNIN